MASCVQRHGRMVHDAPAIGTFMFVSLGFRGLGAKPAGSRFCEVTTRPSLEERLPQIE